jgi:nitroreductase
LDFTSVVENRHSVKHYINQEVPRQKIKGMLQSARLAPSWANEQCWKFIIVDDPSIKSGIADAIPSGNSAADAIMEAPITMVLCAVPECSGKKDGKEFFMMDAGIAMEHLVLAAVNEGLGTCWVGSFDEGKIREILDIPRMYRIVSLTPVGYPGEHSDNTNKKSIGDVAFRNTWDNPVNYLE